VTPKTTFTPSLNAPQPPEGLGSIITSIVARLLVMDAKHSKAGDRRMTENDKELRLMRWLFN
jgi:hypothetical protein